MVKKTALFNAHVELGADMVDFSGFEMPIRYTTSIIDEHKAVRTDQGMFDTSHMGRFFLNGEDAKQFLELLVPRDLTKLKNGMAFYTFILNENGCFKDDVIISQFSNTEFLLVCNAGNRDKIWNWITTIGLIWQSARKKVEFVDKSDTSCMIAVQGPNAIKTLESLFKMKLPEKRFRICWIRHNSHKILFSTTGYTGEAGGELMIFSTKSEIEGLSLNLWWTLNKLGILPCALGSRDTLRLEAGYRLYGNDISEKIHLFESGLDFYPFISLNKPSGFIGQNAIELVNPTDLRTTVGFKLLEKGIARHDYKILDNGLEIGKVLSGTQSPLLKISFGLALLDRSYSKTGSKFQIDIRGKLKLAETIKLPIYDTEKYGMNRI